VFCFFNVTSVGTIKLTKFMTIPFSELNRETIIYIMLNAFLTVYYVLV